MGQGNPGLVQNMNSDIKAYNENSVKFIHLFIYKLRQEVWITHRASSTTRTKKKNGNAETELGRTSIKNQQHIRSSKLFNGPLNSFVCSRDALKE